MCPCIYLSIKTISHDDHHKRPLDHSHHHNPAAPPIHHQTFKSHVVSNITVFVLFKFHTVGCEWISSEIL